MAQRGDPDQLHVNPLGRARCNVGGGCVKLFCDFEGIDVNCKDEQGRIAAGNAKIASDADKAKAEKEEAARAKAAVVKVGEERGG